MPHLTLVEQGSGKTHRIPAPEALAGRDPACPVFLEGEEAKTVSGRHARFFFDDARWFVEDAGSRNGTYIGTRKLEPGTRHQLAIGDVISLGLTGTQLSVKEVVGRAFAATMVESGPAGQDRGLGGEQVRLVLRATQGASRLTGQGDKVTIGRALECLIRVEGENATSVSRVHAEVGVANGRISVRDGGSRHGTFLNGKKIEGAVALKPGDVLMLGPGGPNFSVEEVSIVPAGPPSSSPPPSADARDASVNPTGVTPARKASAAVSTPVPSSVVAGDEARQSTPGLGQPAFRSSPSNRPVTRGTTACKSSSRGRAVWIGGVLAAVVAAAVIVAVVIRDGDRAEPESNGVRQQATELEATHAAALNDARLAKQSLDSAVNAAAPSAVVDSLQRAFDEANSRSAALDDSLRRVRSSVGGRGK